METSLVLISNQLVEQRSPSGSNTSITSTLQRRRPKVAQPVRAEQGLNQVQLPAEPKLLTTLLWYLPDAKDLGCYPGILLLF